MFANTPEPPYTAVIFTTVAGQMDDQYHQTASAMEALAAQQPGYLGIESARSERSDVGITVSYWRTEHDARAWKANADHLAAQTLGAERWYKAYRVRVATVERDYSGPA